MKPSMTARGLLISWATPAASRPTEASLLLYSILWKTCARATSASRIRRTMFRDTK